MNPLCGVGRGELFDALFLEVVEREMQGLLYLINTPDEDLSETSQRGVSSSFAKTS